MVKEMSPLRLLCCEMHRTLPDKASCFRAFKFLAFRDQSSELLENALDLRY